MRQEGESRKLISTSRVEEPYFFYLPTRHPTPGKFRPSVRDIPQIPPQPPHSIFSFFITI